MSSQNVKRLDALLRQLLKLKPGAAFNDSTEISSLCSADWRVIDLGIAVETEFGVEMSADKALALKTVGAWRRLVRQ